MPYSNQWELRTPVSYYGGKQALLHHTIPMFPGHEVYTEVFFGGGAEFFAKVPVANETINDKLDICINFYQQIKSNFPELQALITESLFSRTLHRRAQTYLHKKTKVSPVQKAWAFWYCTNFSFSNKIGGGIKYSNRQNTCPPQVMQNKKLHFTNMLCQRLENVHIENTDALKVLKSRNVAAAFHRLDPPYMYADQGHYKGYTMQDFEALLSWCATECKGKFLLSNYNSTIMDSYIKAHGWNKIEIEIRLQSANKKYNLTNKKEVLVSNYSIKDLQYKLFNSDHI